MARSRCSSNYPSLVTNEHCGGERAPLRTRRADVRKRMNVRGPTGRCLQSTSIGGSETPAFRCGGWGEPQQFGRELQQLGADAGKRYSPPQRTFAHRSSAVLIRIQEILQCARPSRSSLQVANGPGLVVLDFDGHQLYPRNLNLAFHLFYWLAISN